MAEDGATAPTGAPTAQAHADDWATKVTDTVESIVAIARDHSLRPILTALRAVLVGLIALGLGTLMFILVVIGVIRVLTADLFNGRVWASDLVVGGICVLLAVVLMLFSRRFGRKAVNHA